MKRKLFAFVSVLAVLCSLVLIGCGGKGSSTSESAETAEATQTTTETTDATKAAADYQIDYGTSQLYTQADMDGAIDTIMAEFGNWKGCTMKRIAFTDDTTCTDNLAYANSLRKDGQPEFTQAIVFTSDFHSPSKEEAEGTAWEPDTDYVGYNWTLGRTDGGAWELLTWGYA
ncbi:MAG: hypothetical protein Q4C09_09030 [Atopobiaceae bacterium]|nr:hypothetical protein [Atopobiaceae bacterium]